MTLSKKCSGCGAILQNENESSLGYSSDLEKELCHRCFSVKHYGNFSYAKINNQDVAKIIKEEKINKNIVFIFDALYFDVKVLTDTLEQFELRDREVTVVLNKVDLLPKQISRNKLTQYTYAHIKHAGIKVKKVFVSSFLKNESLDEIFAHFEELSGKIYLLGQANSGKSTLVNALIKLTDSSVKEVTTSVVPGTTVNRLEIKVGENKVIDLPGYFNSTATDTYLDPSELRFINPSVEIKQRVYQLKVDNGFWLDTQAYFQIVSQEKKTGVSVFASNELYIHRTPRMDKEILSDDRFKLSKSLITNYKEEVIQIRNDGVKIDIVIPGLGFIMMTSRGQEIKLITREEVEPFIRESLFNK